MTAPTDILDLAEDGGEGERILHGGAHRCLGRDAGRPAIPHHFNVVVDEVVRHWVSVMAEGAEERGGRRQEGKHQNALFYADNGMVASSESRWLQVYFISLVGLFNRVGLDTNFRKAVGMVCCPCQATGTQS